MERDVKPEGSGKDYTADLSYPSPFVFGQTPLQMQWAAASAGAVAGPLTGPFSYCDLGCGDGNTLNVLAAEYPQSTFVGVDFNSDQLRIARERAGWAGLDNVAYLHAAFSDLQEQDLPAMDYMAVHGVYSWVASAVRDSIHAFVEDRLKPGGLVCIQYASMPGSTVHDPLFSYLRGFAGRASGNTAARFAAGLETLHRLMPFAAFFDANPQAAGLIDRLGRHPLAQVAHDVLNRNLHSFYFYEVRDAMASIGLDFMGSANLKINHPEIMMSREAYAVYADVVSGADASTRETIKDMMLNTVSRCDVFRKPGKATPEEHREPGLRELGGLFLHRIDRGETLNALRQASQSSAVDLSSDLHRAVIDAVVASPTIDAVLDAPALCGIDRTKAERAIAQLYVARFLNVLLQPGRETERARSGPYRLTARLNEIILHETIGVPEPVAFASPVLGTALLIPLEARLRLMTLLAGDPDPVWRELRRLNRQIPDRAGRPIESRDRFRSEIESAFGEFMANAVPELLRFGLLEPAG